ncbi:Dipeptide transport system permease protein dppB [uncultured Clostridium sp.]|jgi:peptide/nickel transport system permease protein|nr:Dipeptide transport system permease protein dppB [uncultured Clostridium sp.]
MHKYIIKRILMLIPVIIGVSLLVFVMLDLAPGNIIDIIGSEMSVEEVAQLTHELGYDRSVFYRYFLYVKGLLHGDLGTSYIYKMDVWSLYMQRLPATLELAGASVVLAIILSIPLGIKAATHHGGVTDNVSMVAALLGLSMPNFWLGMMLVVLFSNKLGLLPSYGASDGIKSLILPAFTIGTGLMATLTRTTRSSMLDVLRADYLRTARSKGVTEKLVVDKHALKNALIPIITVIGTQLGNVVGGAVVTENVFAWPGVGRLIIDAINQRDTNTVTGCIIMTTIMICIIQVIVDIVYSFVDPRLRAQYAGGKKKEKSKTGGASA